MFEEMSIGVRMAIDGDPTQQLNRFTQSVKKGYEATTLLTEKLALLNEQFLKSSEILAKLNPSLKEFSSVLKLSSDSGKGLSRTFTSLDRKLGGMAERMEIATRKANMLAESMEGVSVASGSASASAGLAFRGASGGGRRHGGIGGIHPRGVHFGGLGFTGMAIGAGIGLMALHGGYEVSKNYQQALAQFQLMNMVSATPQQADAWVRTHNMRGVSNIQMMDALTDAANATKNFADAKLLAPYLARIEYANSAIFAGTTVPSGRTENQNMLRVAEQRSGSKDPRLLIPALQYMQQVKASSGGRVNASDYQQLAKASGIMGKTSSNDFFYYGLEPIVQEQGAFRTGTQLRGTYNALVAGRMTTASAKDFQSLGLVKPGFAEYNRIGMIKRIKPGGIKDSDLAQTNLEQWVYGVYLPALAAKGITSQKDIQRHIAIDFTNTDQTLIGLMVMQQEKILANIEANKRGARIDESTQIASKLASGKEKDLAAAYSKFKQALGDLSSPAVLKGMDKLTKLLNLLANTMNYFNGGGGFKNTVIHGSDFLPNHPFFKDTIIHNPFEHHTEPPQPAQHHTATAQSTIILQVDGRNLMQTILPHLNQSTYHAQIQSPNRFNPSITPSVVGTHTPY